MAAQDCMASSYNDRYGENVFSVSDTSYTPHDVVLSWYIEKENYDYDNPEFSINTGHFSQVIWKNTTQIGVGFVRR